MLVPRHFRTDLEWDQKQSKAASENNGTVGCEWDVSVMVVALANRNDRVCIFTSHSTPWQAHQSSANRLL